MDTNIITFGAGSFWTLEAIFREVVGVKKVTSGYSGGKREPYLNHYMLWPDVDDFNEVVQVEYDPNSISLIQLLYIFITTHDPTSYKQIGSTAESKYRSVIFYENLYEKNIIDFVLQNVAHSHTQKIVTEVKQLGRFFKAQDSEQMFYERHKKYGAYLRFIDIALNKFRKQHSSLLNHSFISTEELISA